MIHRLEVLLRDRFGSRRLEGAVLAAAVAGSSYAAAYGAVRAACSVHPFLGAGVSSVIIFTCLSTRSLAREALFVLKALNKDDPGLYRRRAARIVGRDTANLSRDDVVRATLESVSENIVDGIIAPLLYAFLGGAPLALAYKAINTLDSMVGYTNHLYRDFGWCSARLDDAVNYIPARLSAACIAAASLAVFPSRIFRVISVCIRDGGKSPSPNAGIPESCFSGALGVRLGGPSTYNGVVHEKPYIGDDERPVEPDDIKRAVRLLWASSFFSLAVFLGTGIIVTKLCF